MACFKITKNVYKNAGEKLLSVLRFLNIMSATVRNIAHTMSYFLLEVRGCRYY